MPTVSVHSQHRNTRPPGHQPALTQQHCRIKEGGLHSSGEEHRDLQPRQELQCRGHNKINAFLSEKIAKNVKLLEAAWALWGADCNTAHLSCGPPAVVGMGWLLSGNPARKPLFRATASLPHLQNHGHLPGLCSRSQHLPFYRESCEPGEAKPHPSPSSTGQNPLSRTGDRSPALTAAQFCPDTSVMATPCHGCGAWAAWPEARSPHLGRAPVDPRHPVHGQWLQWADGQVQALASPGAHRCSGSSSLSVQLHWERRERGPAHQPGHKWQCLRTFCSLFLQGWNNSLTNCRLWGWRGKWHTGKEAVYPSAHEQTDPTVPIRAEPKSSFLSPFP